jgi:hypothetical protein
VIDETFSQANQNVVLSCEATFNTFSYRDTNNSYSVEWFKGSRPVGEVYPLNELHLTLDILIFLSKTVSRFPSFVQHVDRNMLDH